MTSQRTWIIFFVFFLLLFILCFFSTYSLANAFTYFLLSTDTRGYLETYEDYTIESGHGGMARRATLINELRQQNPSLLLLDAGNAFFGGQSLAHKGEAILSAYNALDYDALNLSFRDFRFGKQRTVELAEQADFPVISANILNSSTQEPLAQPYTVARCQGQKLALIGVTQQPAGYDYLPHLQDQLAGVQIEAPETALKKCLPKAKAKSDRIILLYYGSYAGLKPILKEFGRDISLVLVGGSEPEYLPAEHKPPIIGTYSRGQHLASVQLDIESGEVETKQVAVGPEIQPDAHMQAMLEPYLQETAWDYGQKAALKEKDAEQQKTSSFETGQSSVLRISGSNRALQLSIGQYTIRKKYGKYKVLDDHSLMILATTWENIIPLKLVGEIGLATKYVLPDLRDHLYGVLNGHRLLRVHSKAEELAGHVPVNPLILEKIGSVHKGNVIFQIPDQEIQSLELRLYDYVHGHITMPILGAPQAQKDKAKPIGDYKQNSLLQAGFYDIHELQKYNGQMAPPGMCYRLINFRARSLFSYSADATAFDPKAKPGETIEVDTVAEWLESRKYMQLIIDGEYAYLPLPSSDLSPSPRFLPDLMTGGRVVFLTPKEFQSLELGCDFPHARIPETDQTLQPNGLTFSLKGKRPELQDRPALTSIDDDCFQVHFVSQKIFEEFAGNRAGSGKHFFVLDVTVINHSDTGEFFQPAKQLYYVSVTGNKHEMHATTFAGPHPPLEQLWIPKNEQRSFQAVFAIKAAEDTLRLAYHGLSLAKIVSLPPIGQANKGKELSYETVLTEHEVYPGGEKLSSNLESSDDQDSKPTNNVLLRSQAPDKRQQEATGSPLLQANNERSVEERKEQSRTLAPGERIFTTNQDFNQGYLFNLNHKSPNEDQLQINTVPKPFPYVNVAASERGTVVRIDADTGSIVGEYRTAPEKRWRDPSRTTVDLLGNIWAGNREEDKEDQGSVVKIGLIIGGARVDSEAAPSEKGEFLSPPFVYNTCVDRNNDGLIKTSRGLGNILPWPDRTDGSGGETAFIQDAEDECILLYQRTSGVAIRHVSVDADNNVWVGGYPQHPSFFDKLDGQTGSRLETFSAAEIGCGGYGGLIDDNGVLWSSSKVQDKLLRYDPHSRTGICIPVHSSYGLGIDSKGFIWNSNHSWSEIVKIDPEGEIQPGFPKETGHWAALRGVAVTLSDDNIWVANSNLQDVSRLDNQGNLRKVIDVEERPTGVAVDHNGKVWATNMKSDSVSRIDPNAGEDGLGAVDLTVDLGPDAEPYNYSDMTGAVVAGATAKQGMWNMIYDSQISGTAQTTLRWNTEPSGSQPPGSSILVQVRAGGTPAELSSQRFVSVENGVPIDLKDPYLEIRTTLKRGNQEKSPVLSDLSIIREGGTGRLAVHLKGDGTELKPRIEIILDASGSMREQKRKIDGQLKIEVAKEVLAQIIKSLSESTEVAFRVYGHRIREGRPGDCEDTELLFPFGQLDRERLLEQVRRTQALGTTPLAFSLEQAAKDFPEDGRGKVIILITDGKEECGADPAATVAELVQRGLDIRVNVVGFGLAEESTKQDMEKVAQITGGTFFDAQDRQTLFKALQSPLSIPFEVFNSSGSRIAGGKVGETIELPVGEYTVRAQIGTQLAEVSGVYIQNKTLSEIELIFEKKTKDNR